MQGQKNTRKAARRIRKAGPQERKTLVRKSPETQAERGWEGLIRAEHKRAPRGLKNKGPQGEMKQISCDEARKKQAEVRVRVGDRGLRWVWTRKDGSTCPNTATQSGSTQPKAANGLLPAEVQGSDDKPKSQPASPGSAQDSHSTTVGTVPHSASGGLNTWSPHGSAAA